MLTDTGGVLSATAAAAGGGGTVTPSNGGTTLTISGTLAQLNADLTTLTDDDATTAADTITVNATDTNGGSAPAASVAVTVNGVPAITASTSATVQQNQATAVTGVSVSETGNTTTSGETFTATLTDTNGVLSTTGTGVSGSGTTSLTISDATLAQLNADLSTLTDTDGSTAAGFDRRQCQGQLRQRGGGKEHRCRCDNQRSTAATSQTDNQVRLPFVPGAAGKPVTVATATPALPGDTLSLVTIQAPQSGKVLLQGTSVQYTPTTSSAVFKPVTFSFDVKDQLGGTTPVYTVIVGGDLANNVTGNSAGNTDIGLGNGLNKITLAGSGNVVDAGNGANGVSGGVSNNTIILGNGLDGVNLSGGSNTVTLGNGVDSVSVGGWGTRSHSAMASMWCMAAPAIRSRSRRQR